MAFYKTMCTFAGQGKSSKLIRFPSQLDAEIIFIKNIISQETKLPHFHQSKLIPSVLGHQ